MNPVVKITGTIAMLLVAVPAIAETIPFADTEDATLSTIDVDAGDFHLVLSTDLRNGDYARGAFDDDNVGLGRVPVHIATGGALVLQRRDDGDAVLFLLGQSSNGFHKASTHERTRPQAWYESNNLVGIAWRPAAGVNVATTYTVKTSPNGVAATTQEASLSFLYGAEDSIGRFKPRVAMTRRTRGSGGVYTIAGLAPSFDLASGGRAATLSVPLTLGIGWRDFYANGSGNRIYGSGGLSIAKPLSLGRGRATLQAEMLALVRDNRLRRLDAPTGTTAAIVPYATLSLAVAW